LLVPSTYLCHLYFNLPHLNHSIRFGYIASTTQIFLFGVRERRGTQHHAVILLNTDNAPYLKVKKHFRGDLKDEN